MNNKITIKQAADRYGCHGKTIRRMIARGQLTAYRKPGDRCIYLDDEQAAQVFTFKPVSGAA